MSNLTLSSLKWIFHNQQEEENFGIEKRKYKSYLPDIYVLVQ